MKQFLKRGQHSSSSWELRHGHLEGVVLSAVCCSSLRDTSLCSSVGESLWGGFAAEQFCGYLPTHRGTFLPFSSLLRATSSSHLLPTSHMGRLKSGPAGMHFGERTACIYTPGRALQHQALWCRPCLNLSKEYPFRTALCANLDTWMDCTATSPLWFSQKHFISLWWPALVWSKHSFLR